jgi:DNA-binding XRE family transcriptional regulator
MVINMLELEGKQFVVVPKEQFDILLEKAGVLPELPPADAQGYRPAVPALRAAIARKLIRRRIAAGLSQQELAKRAGIRAETLNRLESGKHAPQRETLVRIDKVLTTFEKLNSREVKKI